ncbi:MAG: RsmE family RNA methyltransferase [Ilumatobacteraceae bacterium]
MLRGSAAHVFVELDLGVERIQPAPEVAHHLFRVLRLRDGASVTVSDGRGRWRPTVVDGDELLAVGDVETVPADRPCRIAVAAPKGERFDWLVEKLTEVGVSDLALIVTRRAVVRWDDDRAVRRLERARRIALEAAAQSRRVWLPTIHGPLGLDEVLQHPGTVVGDPDGTPLVAAEQIVIGPEGGFAPDEIPDGVPRVRLADTVLRVETAAVVAAVRLRALHGE